MILTVLTNLTLDIGDGAMNLIDLAKEAGLCPIRGGASYSSPCPGCGGNNRFIIWPNNRYWCRRCEKGGDSIQFCRDFLGMSYADACKKLHVDMKPFPSQVNLKVLPNFKIANKPPRLWQEKAFSFVKWCHQLLLSYPEKLSKLFERGLNHETIIKSSLGLCLDPTKIMPSGFFREKSAWGLSEESKDGQKAKKLWLPYGLVIPYFGSDELILKLKIRRLDWFENDKLPKYVEITGSMQQPSWFGSQDRLPVVIVEAEFDALLVRQEAGDLCCALALGGAKKKPDFETNQRLHRSPLLLYALDFDDAGKEQFLFWRKTYPHLRAWPTPTEKSPGDAFKKGANIRQWIIDGISQYENIIKGNLSNEEYQQKKN